MAHGWYSVDKKVCVFVMIIIAMLACWQGMGKPNIKKGKVYVCSGTRIYILVQHLHINNNNNNIMMDGLF